MDAAEPPPSDPTDAGVTEVPVVLDGVAREWLMHGGRDQVVHLDLRALIDPDDQDGYLVAEGRRHDRRIIEEAAIDPDKFRSGHPVPHGANSPPVTWPCPDDTASRVKSVMTAA